MRFIIELLAAIAHVRAVGQKLATRTIFGKPFPAENCPRTIFGRRTKMCVTGQWNWTELGSLACGQTVLRARKWSGFICKGGSEDTTLSRKVY